ncbi:Bifunctional inhibitor/lipid-transfer protein/seed storage 2S albumin superfamily protein [Rhynchospora pubera]|uniref:Bifunctional inhibitor/lipid-transfer protein/seed storage 2S albumin superfamily protein n=1 Tax=Rhynchospora pubera TaxID=906938 RepID=A0AAV8EN27_9POAL|nr:Bifunctional inhibitor/lipid-transfer protein/seed storage 2S albumin superfamily protein [Rhynchospora pubera]
MERILGRRFLALLILVAAAVATQTKAQNLPCVNELAACSKYYNDTSLTPTRECCDPLDHAVKNEISCVCAVFTNPSLQKQLGINVQKGMGLLSRCNITSADPNVCTSTPPASPPKASVPPPPPSGASFGAEWIGFTTFISLLLFNMA